VGTATVKFSPTDSQSGVASTKYRIDGGSLLAGTAAVVGSLGTHRIDFSSCDYSGNVEPTQTVTFDVLRRLDDANPQVAYTGTWATSTDSRAYGGSYHVSRTSGSSLVVTFQGPRIDWIAALGPCYGIASASIDGSSPVSVDLYRSTWPEQATAYSFTGLSDAVHTLTISWTGSRNASATDTYIGADSFDVARDLTVDNQAPVTTADAKTSYPGSATITLAAVDGMSGVASTNYSLDSGAWTTGTVVTCSTLGNHTLSYCSIDKAGNRETTKSVSFDVVTRIDSADPAITDIGAWTTTTDAKSWLGSYQVSRVATAEIDYTFFGTGVDWIAPLGPCYGIASVTIDSGSAHLVDLYRTSWPSQAVAFSSAGLSSGSHTIKIMWTGTKNASATDTYVGIDALDIYH
jgi:hypothetical protein